MIMFHPWIDWLGNILSSSSSFVSSNAPAAAATPHVTTNNDEGAFSNVTTLVEKNESLQYLVMNSLSMTTQQEFISLPSFVDEEYGRGEVTPRPIDGMDEHDFVVDVDDDANDGRIEEEKIPREAEEEVSSNNVICVNCHALFRIHVDVTFQGQDVETSVLSSSSTETQYQEEGMMNWFITLRDVTHDSSCDEVVYVMQMDQPLDLHCNSATAVSVHRRDNVCNNHSLNRGGCNSNHHVFLQKCQSIAIIEVPYTSFSSTAGYNSTNHHEVTNERIILVSLQRQWISDSTNDVVVVKKRRIVDQWMINVVVPSNKDGDGGGNGALHSSSIYTAKLRDVIKIDSIASSSSSSSSAEGRKEKLGSSSKDEHSSFSSSSVYEVIIACLVGLLCGVAILAIAFKFVIPRDEEEEEDEEVLMTTPGILALQRAIRDSNSVARQDDHEEEVESTIQYESGERRSSEEESEARSATPTNLSPLFDDEADSKVLLNHDDEDDTIQEQNDGSEEVEESRSEDDGGSEVEGSVQDQFDEDEHFRAEDEDNTAIDMIDEDEETPPTSNKSKRSKAPRRNSVVNVDDIIREQNETTASNSPLFYSPKFQTDETVPLPHSNTSSVYDLKEQADGANNEPTVSVQQHLTSPADTNHSSVERRAGWNEFGAFAQDREVFNAAEDDEMTDDDEVSAAHRATEESTMSKDEDDPTLSGVSKRLVVTSKQAADEEVKTSSSHDEVGELDESMFLPNVNARAEANADEDDPNLSDVSKRLFVASKQTDDEAVKDVGEIDESMLLPNVKVQAEANASPLLLHGQKNAQVEATSSPPELYRKTMASNAKCTFELNPPNKPTASCDELAKSMNPPDVDARAEAGGSLLVKPLADSQQTAVHPRRSKNTVAVHATVTYSKSFRSSSPSNAAFKAPKNVKTPHTAPMSSYKDNSSPSSANASVEKSEANRDACEASTVAKVTAGSLGKTALSTATRQLPSSPSPNGSHDLSYVNQSLSVSSSPSVTSAPRNSNSPSVTSDPRFNSGEWDNSHDDSDIEAQQRKRRSLPFVSREDTSHAGKENASSNSRTPLSAKATSYSPSSTVAATVAEFAVPRKSNGLAWRLERPVPIPTGNAGQNKRLGGSPSHFEHLDESNDESIDLINGAVFSSQNDNSPHNGSSRSGKRSRTSNGSKDNKKTSRKRKAKNVEKKLLATTKTSDKHKPPSGLSCLSQRLNDEMWRLSQLQSSNKS